MHKTEFRHRLGACLGLILLFGALASMIPVTHATSVTRWDLDRPSCPPGIAINERIENLSTTNEASVGIGVHVVGYAENSSSSWYENGDGLELRVTATANTRKGIQYTHTRWGRLTNGFPDTEYMSNTGITADNAGAPISLPFDICFYGGGDLGIQNRSGYYNRLWVCSNGFISLDSELTSPYPRNIPCEEPPNALIAVYWTDLDPSGGAIKYAISGSPDNEVIVVWDNVLNKAKGTRETFGVRITQETDPVVRGQSKIQFLYKNVSGDVYAVLGLEDHEGYKGYTPGFVPAGEDEVWFRAQNSAPEIQKMRIRAEKNDGLAKIKISVDDENLLRGINLKWKRQEPDPQATYAVSINGGLTLLLSSGASILLRPVGGYLWGGALLLYNTVQAEARHHWPVYKLDGDPVADESETFADVRVTAAHIAGPD